MRIIRNISEIFLIGAICFEPSMAGKLVVELERCQITEQELTICDEAMTNLTQQIETQAIMLDTQEQALQQANEVIKQQEELLKKKCPKPSLTGEFLKGLGLVGLGIIITILGGL